ncbi:Gfo/Idh/MocA family protein [Oceanobacillus sp. J11TS1]|uniref:Gfo/Idh/MocA family protein n=1 Tax=Oceanobacillus sp. J11TS1 TaxID=2807191 RepID=UPI001B1F3E4F|nr:Gfo/Idh/MocA family oxidoreductase [Oceanobacillus sp. J11TS1]GIO23843.1 Gfo/Idh/MocA family oxidoreductase [Oceanobacillus sp. J11TS1]
MERLKMGLIGVGGIAENRHIPAYQAWSEHVEITALQDVNLVRAKEVAEKYAIPNVFEDYLELFKHVDAVTICTPNKFHEAIAVAALNQGVHVLCEKPMAMNADEGRRMIEAAEKNNRILMIGYHYRFMEAVALAKKSMEEVGNPIVTRVQALRQRKVPGWGVFINKQLQGGGSLIDWGCHLLDASLWLVSPSKPVEVNAQTYQCLSKQPEQVNDWGSYDHEAIDVDDHVSAYIRFDDQSTLLFECSWAANIKEDHTHISISGEKGGLSVFPYEVYQPKYGRMMETNTDLKEDDQQAGIFQAKNFIDACLGKEKLKHNPNDALQVTKVIDAIYESSEHGKSIFLEA